jgi:hypothetical protein
MFHVERLIRKGLTGAVIGEYPLAAASRIAKAELAL